MAKRVQRFVGHVHVLAGEVILRVVWPAARALGIENGDLSDRPAASSWVCARWERSGPNTTSAMALPASFPRNHAASMASAFSASQGMTSGRPENSTTTTRKPWPGLAQTPLPRARAVVAALREMPGSPPHRSYRAVSPMHNTTASASLHRSTAARDTGFVAAAECNARCMHDLSSGQSLRNPVTHTDAVFRPARSPPTAAHLDRSVGQWPDHAQPPQRARATATSHDRFST